MIKVFKSNKIYQGNQLSISHYIHQSNQTSKQINLTLNKVNKQPMIRLTHAAYLHTHTQGITSECVGVYINVSRQNTFQQKITINNKEIETRRVLKMGDRRVFLFLISNRNHVT